MKLGLFAMNGSGEQVWNLPPRDSSWATNLHVARLADAAGFEALVPYARWKGIPRPAGTPFVSHDAFESFTWAAAIAQATRHAAIFATVHVPMVHPIYVAKMVTTVDHVSNGRFALNVVAGWNGPEFTMFGAPLKPHDDRYVQGAEWIEILRKLWTERAFDFEGTYYRIEAGESFPKPVQQPYPPIMNAGGSAAGRAFAAKYADMCFVMVSDEDDFAIAREQIASYRALAREYGKEIAVWTYTDVILRDSQAEADAYAAYLDEHRNAEAAATLRGIRNSSERMLTLESGKHVPRNLRPIALTGDAVRMNERMARLAEIGIDGVLLLARDFADMVPRWTRDVLPLMERSGLREPFTR